MIVVVSVEDVLSEVGVPLHEAGPTLFGRRLYTTLHNAGESLVLLSTDQHGGMVKEWLLREGFSDYVKLLVRGDALLSPSAWKAEQVQKLVSAGHHVSYMVDNDPAVLSAATRLGIPVLLALHAVDSPGRMSEEDGTYRSWGDVVDTIQAESLKQAEARRRRAGQDD